MNELTEEEIQWVKTTRRLSPEMREFLKERGGPEEIGKATAVHRALAADAQAEADAIFAVRQRKVALGDGAAAADWRTRAISAESRAKEMEQTITEKDRQIEHVLARDSMAVFSED